MKLYILLIILFFGISINAYATANKKILENKSADLKAIKRIDGSISNELKKNMATYMALQSTKYHLEKYLKEKDKESFTILTSGWSLEDQMLVKQDLQKMDRSLVVEIVGNSLVLKTRQGQVQLEVEDAMMGRYRINGKSLLITSFRRYERVKEEINEAISSQEQARFQLMHLFLTPAHAIGFLAPLAPVVAPAATAAATTKAIAVAKFVGLHIALPIAVGGASAYAINKFAAHDFARNLAYYNPERVVRLMCEGKMSPTAHFDREVDCASVKKSDMEVEIKRPDKEELYPVPNPKMDRKCEKTSEGFSRDTGLTFHKKSENGDIRVNHVEAIHRLRFEFISNPKDPKKLITKTMVETVFDRHGNRQGQRVWAFEGDDFVIREYTHDQLNQLDNAFKKHSVSPTVIDCTGKKLTDDEVCKKLDKGLLAAAKPQISCTMDNPEEVIEQIKAEKKEEKSTNKSRSFDKNAIR